jgi:hypothetical protein
VVVLVSNALTAIFMAEVLCLHYLRASRILTALPFALVIVNRSLDVCSRELAAVSREAVTPNEY